MRTGDIDEDLVESFTLLNRNLRDLRNLSDDHASALAAFWEDEPPSGDNGAPGFYHLMNPREDATDPNVTSSSTCWSSLSAAGLFPEFLSCLGDNGPELLNEHFRFLTGVKRESASLPHENPFTTAHLLMGLVTLAEETHSIQEVEVPDELENRMRQARDTLVAHLALSAVCVDNPEETDRSLIECDGVPGFEPEDDSPITVEDSHLRLDQEWGRGNAQGVRIPPFPATGFLTFIAWKALDRIEQLRESEHEQLRDLASSVGLAEEAWKEVCGRARAWATEELNHQLALKFSGSETHDPYQLGYCCVLIASLTDHTGLTPEDRRILQKGIDAFFESQRDDGLWPPSRPIFHYTEHGDAYCYEFELLFYMLEVDQPFFREILGRRIHQFMKAFPTLQLTRHRLEDNRPGSSGEREVYGWLQAHHPHFSQPQSWATACVYHFVFALSRLIQEAVNEVVFEYLRNEYASPSGSRGPIDLTEELLDSPIEYGDSEGVEKFIRPAALLDLLVEEFLDPIQERSVQVRTGLPIGDDVDRTAILCGPPGTAKTKIANLTADYLGWPLLEIDPSHFVRRGQDQLQAEADLVFEMLASLHGVVVFFDEVDEFVRARGRDSEFVSRFLTTSMLPKVNRIRERMGIVFLVATNYVQDFDDAIIRRGRFDAIIPVLPPHVDAKVGDIDGPAWWGENAETLSGELDVDGSPGLRKKLHELTWGETLDLIGKLESGREENPADVLHRIHSEGTMTKPAGSSPEAEAAGQGEITWRALFSEGGDAWRRTRLP